MIGPWALGTTQLVYEGGFNPETWYKLIQDYKVTVWYTAPTAILMRKLQAKHPVRALTQPSRHLLSR
ncbi:MAG: hypothetical protein R2857_00615 [Vampirovibrionales bacterium]